MSNTTYWSATCTTTGCTARFNQACTTPESCSTAEACPDTWYPDVDRDGYGDLAGCRPAPGFAMFPWVQTLGDCHDRLVIVHPGAEEIIGDGLDNDCDGVAR